MHRKLLVVTASLLLCASSAAHAQRRATKQVGLGVAAGASWPMASEAIQGGLSGASFDWGFFVDIPLVAAFHITPSAMLYRLKVNDNWHSVTDIDLNFKFIVPIGPMSLHAGVLMGLTSGADLDPKVLTPHSGVLGGVALELVSNLEGFVMVNYKMLFHELERVNNLHTYAGVMIRM